MTAAITVSNGRKNVGKHIKQSPKGSKEAKYQNRGRIRPYQSVFG